MKCCFVTLLFCLALSGAWATFPLPFFHIGFMPPQNHYNNHPLARFIAPFFDFQQFRRDFMNFPPPPNFIHPSRFNYFEYPQPQRFATFPEFIPRPQNNPQGPLVQYIYQQTALNPAPTAVELPMKNQEPVMQLIYKPETTTENSMYIEATKVPMNLGFQPIENMQNIYTQSLPNPLLVPAESLEPVVQIYNKFGEEHLNEIVKPVESTTNSINSATVSKPEESTTNSMNSASVAIPEESTTNSINSASVAKPEESTTNSINSGSEAKPEESTTNLINSSSATKPEDSATNTTSETESEEDPTKPMQEKESDLTPQPTESNKSEAPILSEESTTTIFK